MTNILKNIKGNKETISWNVDCSSIIEQEFPFQFRIATWIHERFLVYLLDSMFDESTTMSFLWKDSVTVRLKLVEEILERENCLGSSAQNRTIFRNRKASFLRWWNEKMQ